MYFDFCGCLVQFYEGFVGKGGGMHVRLMGLDRACCGNETDTGRIGHVLPCMSQAIWYAMFSAMGWASDPGAVGYA